MFWVGLAFAAEPADAPAGDRAPDLKVKKRSQHPYPRLPAAEVPPFDVACLVRVFIGTDGLPYDARPHEHCPAPFAAETRAAAMEWRWKPYRVDRERVKVQTTLKFVYRPDPGTVTPLAQPSLAAARAAAPTRTGNGGGVAAWPTAGPYEAVAYPGPLGTHTGRWTPRPAEPGPAVVWLGPWGADADAAHAFHEHGLTTFLPGLRGAPDNPGGIECGLGEVDDVLAAVDWLRAQPGVDPDRLYLVGAGGGATLALLVAESTTAFRAVVAIGPERDARHEGCSAVRGDAGDWAARSPLPWMATITTPTWLVEGREAPSRLVAAQWLVQQAGDAPVEALLVPDHTHAQVLDPATVTAARAIRDHAGAEPLALVWPTPAPTFP